MKFYNGLIKFDGSGKIEDIVTINDSFSFSCLFFAPAWLLFHKMWKEFFGLVICIIIIELAFNSLIQDTFLLILAFLIFTVELLQEITQVSKLLPSMLSSTIPLMLYCSLFKMQMDPLVLSSQVALLYSLLKYNIRNT